MTNDTEHPPENFSKLIPVASFDLVVFGAAGDLSLRKLLPSLFRRWLDNQIPENSQIVGVSRTDMTSEQFSDLAFEHFCKNNSDAADYEARWTEFAKHLHYVKLDATTDDPNWAELKKLLANKQDKQQIFYLALPPALYGSVSANIKTAGLISEHAKIVLEKPIGKNLETARDINKTVGSVFDERSIYRIDHYLGKETVQNLIVLRFMNSLFEPVWNSNAIDHVEITVAESLGVGTRAGYYDSAGALRDMVQNHLLQLLCLVAMEPPLDLEPGTLRDEKIKVLRGLRPIGADDVRSHTVRGQYVSGASDGEMVKGYLDELGGGSSTETFVAIKAHVDNWRWKGVPFYLRTGKRMSSRFSEIIIQFRSVAHPLVKDSNMQPTRLVIRLQPDEGVKLLLVTKDPGPGGMRLRYVPLNLSYAQHFEARYPDAYERLLMAVVRGNLGLFMRRDEVEEAWKWVDSIHHAWQADETPVYDYPAGTDGPVQSANMLDRDQREWFDV